MSNTLNGVRVRATKHARQLAAQLSKAFEVSVFDILWEAGDKDSRIVTKADVEMWRGEHSPAGLES